MMKKWQTEAAKIGKRCDAMGFRPRIICEPVVIIMAELLTKSEPEGGK